MSLYLFLEVLIFFSPSVTEHKPSVLKLLLISLNFYKPHEGTCTINVANNKKQEVSKFKAIQNLLNKLLNK